MNENISLIASPNQISDDAGRTVTISKGIPNASAAI